MKLDDMIIISIDDHIVEPPDMFDAHVPAKYRDQAPELVRDAQRLRALGYSRAQRLRHGRPQRHRVVAQGGVGIRPQRSGRDASRLPTSSTSGSGTWTATACWPRCASPAFAGFSGRRFHGGRGQGPGPGHAPGLQRLAHRRVVRVASGPVHPTGHRTNLGHGRRGGRSASGRRPRAAGPSACPSCRTCRACPATTATTGTPSSAPSATRAW